MELSHVQTPALILDLDVFEENARIMQDYVSGTKMALRPHYKSHKCTPSPTGRLPPAPKASAARR